MTEGGRTKMGLLEAVAIGVGTMIGASIFSIFGVGVQIAGPNLPEAMVLSSLLALLVAYSYTRLSSRITSDAGPIEFMLRGLGDNVATGTMSILILMSYVVSISLFLKGFTGYFLPFVGLRSSFLSMALTETAVISCFVMLNFLGSRIVGRAELVIVAVKVLILALLVASGVFLIDSARLAPQFSGQHSTGTFFAMSIFFLSYMGFGLITNASEDIRNPKKNVPKAIYMSIAFVTLVYVLVSATVIGDLPLAQIVQAKENALAVAARPALGGAGFVILTLGALFSISSALNATLYGGANISYTLAKEGELPEVFERKVWFGPTEGLFITAGAGLLLAIFVDLSGIAAITSSIFIAIYLFVFISHYRLRHEVGGNGFIIIGSLVIVSATFLVLMYYQYTQDRLIPLLIAVIFLGAFLFECAYRRVSGRRMRHRGDSDVGGPDA